MPTYDYQCKACGRRFDKFQSITAPARANCAHCGSARTHRVLSPPTFILKGSGFYVTEYRNGSASKSPSKDSKSAEKKPSSGK